MAQKGFIQSSIGRKVLMSLSGLFLSLFLIAHLAGNLLLFVPDDGLAFNAYAASMGENPAILVVRIILFLAIIIHILDAIVISVQNKRARQTAYAVSGSSENSSWPSRNMGILGFLIFVFLVLHIANFFVQANFGELGVDGNENKNLYPVIASSFENWWYSLIYVVSMIALGFHLVHGVKSGFRSLGNSHKKYVPVIRQFSLWFAIIIPVGFALIPIYFLLRSVL